MQRRALIVVAGISLAATCLAKPPRYRAQDLPKWIHNGGICSPSGLSPTGSAVGWQSIQLAPLVYSQRGVVWSDGQALMVMSGGGSDGTTSAYAINASGLIVGFATLSGSFGTPTLLSLTEPPRALDALQRQGAAMCLNNVGEIAGGATFGGQEHAFWTTTELGTLVDLGTLGGTRSEAFAINDDGDIVGMSLDAAGLQRAFIAPGLGAMTDLTSHLPAGSPWILRVANHINASGWTVGRGEKSGVRTAYALDTRGSADAQDLPPTSGRNAGEAFAINASGDAVGNSSLIQGRFEGAWAATLWREGVAYDLNALVVNHTGHSYEFAIDINDAGQVLVYAPLAALPASLLTPLCDADFTEDGFVNGDDFDEFVAAFELGDSRTDFTDDGFVNGDDFDAFIAAFDAGC